MFDEPMDFFQCNAVACPKLLVHWFKMKGDNCIKSDCYMYNQSTFIQQHVTAVTNINSNIHTLSVNMLCNV